MKGNDELCLTLGFNYTGKSSHYRVLEGWYQSMMLALQDISNHLEFEMNLYIIR